MRRFDAIELVLRLAKDRPIVGNLGPTSDELWHAGHRDRNFYTYGTWGCFVLGLAMALATDEQIICMDGTVRCYDQAHWRPSAGSDPRT